MSPADLTSTSLYYLYYKKLNLTKDGSGKLFIRISTNLWEQSINALFLSKCTIKTWKVIKLPYLPTGKCCKCRIHNGNTNYFCRTYCNVIPCLLSCLSDVCSTKWKVFSTSLLCACDVNDDHNEISTHKNCWKEKHESYICFSLLLNKKFFILSTVSYLKYRPKLIKTGISRRHDKILVLWTGIVSQQTDCQIQTFVLE